MNKAKIFDFFTNLLGAPIENLSQSFYDGYVEQNVKFRSKAGLKETIIRIQVAKCCDWCADLSGIYDASRAPENIYRRHENCKCMVTHKSEKGNFTDAWSKKEYKTQKKAREEKEIQLIDINRKKKNDIVIECERAGIQNKKVNKLPKALTEESIIKKVEKLDETSGSCASVALAYAGNRAGYDVTDFRGGKSLEYFCKRKTFRKIAELAGGDSAIEKSNNDLEAALKLIEKVKPEKEYILASGEHVAIIKKEFDKVNYLELQYPPESGFHELTEEKLISRFGLSTREKQAENFLIDCEKLYRKGIFQTILGYLNTR